MIPTKFKHIFKQNRKHTLSKEYSSWQIIEKQSRLYDDRLDEIIDLAKYKAKNNELEGEKEKIEGQIKKINEDSNKNFQVGTLAYLVAQHAD
jgi:DUF917 family protein